MSWSRVWFFAGVPLWFGSVMTSSKYTDRESNPTRAPCKSAINTSWSSVHES